MLDTWTQEQDKRFTDALECIKEWLDEGTSLDWAVAHTSELFEITRDALDHEWELRRFEA